MFKIFNFIKSFNKPTRNNILKDMHKLEIIQGDDKIGYKINDEILKKSAELEKFFQENPKIMQDFFNVKENIQVNQKEIRKLFIKVHTFIVKRAIMHYLNCESFGLLDFKQKPEFMTLAEEKNIINYSKIILEILEGMKHGRAKN